MAELLFDEADLDGAQPAAADLARHVHRVQPERLRLGENLHRAFRREHALALDLLFEREELGAHETAHRVEQQAGRLVG